MSSNLVIAAIPDENDRVWKVSSEKIPHLTVLFLGDVDKISNLEQIMLFVEHAANTTLQRFYLPVDRRGELGDDKADVLFFKKGRYDYKAIRDFRAVLLKDPNIKTAYDSATQFDGPWNPHLTLGYPETPAKPESDDYGSFYDVQFNKIAVWTGDFEGPDFLLKDYWDEMEALECVPMDVAMSDLSHAVKVSDTAWSQFKTSDYTDEQYARACLLDRGEDAGTAKERYGIPVREPDGTLNRNACHAAAAVLSSTGGTGTARGNKVKGTPEQITKAKNKLVALYKGPLNEDVPEGLGGEKSVKQTLDLGSEFLNHHGVKGQKWGVRKVEGGGEGAHIRINQKTGQAAVSKQSTAAIVVPALVMPVLVPAAFLSKRVRAEVKAARAVNKGIAADKKWQKELTTSKRAVEVHNTASTEINKKIPDFNNDKRWKGVDLTKDAAKQKEYDTAVERELLNPEYAKAAVKVHGSSPTGRYKFEIKDPSTALLKLTDTTKVEHAADDEVSVQFKIVRDASGHIVGFNAEDDEEAMAQTADIGAEFLEHVGVKGMRWGIRKDRVTGGAKAVGRGAKKVGRGISTVGKDIAFESTSRMHTKTNEVHLTAAENFRKQDIPRINAKYKDTKGGTLKGRLKNPVHPDTRAYRSESRIAYRDRINEAVAALPTNASGTRKYEIDDQGKTNAQYAWTLKAVDVKKTVKHADSLAGSLLDEFVVQPVFDEDGFITDVKMVGATLAQTVDLGAEFLEHYGIKGMHWGVRGQRAVTTQAHIDSGIARRQTKIRTKGGEAHPPAHDAIKVAISKQKLKKSGVAALSNQELRELQTRLQLETQVQQLTSSKGKKVVTKQLEEEGKQQLSRSIRTGAPAAIKKARKGAATAAVTAALL